MAADDDTRSGFSRRDALRLMAASTTTIAAGSVIISRPAHAANGSQPCTYTGIPRATIRMINQSGNRADYVGITVQLPGSCPCGDRMAVEYAYSGTIPSFGSGDLGWITSSSVSGTRVGLWPNGGGSVTVTVGVRVTCGVGDGATTVCRVDTKTFNVAGPNSDTTETFDIGGTCEPSAGASRAVASGALALNIGLGTPPEIHPDKDDGLADLGTPEDSSTTTTSSSTTTTTEKPGNGPKDQKTDPATATNTPAGSSTGSSTTTTSSTSSTSTTSTSSTTTTTSQP